MSNKDTMICDIETGICGPAETGVIELIDLTSLSTEVVPNSTEQTEKDK